MRRSQKQKELDRKIKENQKLMSRRYAKLAVFEASLSSNDEHKKRDNVEATDRERKSSRRVRRLSELDSESIKEINKDKNTDTEDDAEDHSNRSSLSRKYKLDKANTDLSKARLLDDILKMKEIEKEKELRISEQKHEIKKQKRRLAREKERERMTSSEESDSKYSSFKKGNRSKSKNGARDSKNSKKSVVSLYLETTDSLYDESGNLLANNSRVKFLGKANDEYDSLRSEGRRKKSKSKDQGEGISDSLRNEDKRKRSKSKDREEEINAVDEKELMQILHAVEIEEVKKKLSSSNSNKTGEQKTSSQLEEIKYFYNDKEVKFDVGCLENKKAIVILNYDIKELKDQETRPNRAHDPSSFKNKTLEDIFYAERGDIALLAKSKASSPRSEGYNHKNNSLDDYEEERRINHYSTRTSYTIINSKDLSIEQERKKNQFVIFQIFYFFFFN